MGSLIMPSIQVRFVSGEAQINVDEGVLSFYDGLEIVFFIRKADDKRQALSIINDLLKTNNINWLRPANTLLGEWIVDLDEASTLLKYSGKFSWMAGPIFVYPEVNLPSVRFVVTPTEVIQTLSEFLSIPELDPFLERFYFDYPDPLKCCFLMMKFQKTRLHKSIIKAIKDTCNDLGIIALRADEKSYADELLPNIRTYMHGCGFGIAVFERLTGEDFNPNISLEVGYMMALGKPVCLLKDQTLAHLHTDIVGRLYESFDTQDPEGTITPVLEKWLVNKGIIEDNQDFKNG
jgi:hypothetical protein